MVTTELYIGNIKVDTNEDVAFALNYWMADIRNPESRNTDFSKTITIPGTAENNKIFTHIYQIGVDSTFNPNNKANVILITGGARNFRGYAQLKNIIRLYEGMISYEVTLFGELGDLFQSMGESYIDALNFDSLAHVKDTPTVFASWFNTSGYVYPIINNGQMDVVTQSYLVVQVADMRPALFAKTIWDKIFETHGFKYNSTFVSGSPFNKLICPAIRELKRRTASISGFVTFGVTATDTTSVTINIKRINNAGTITTIYSETKTSSSGFFPTFNILGNFFVDPFDQLYITTSWTSADPGASADIFSTAVWGIVYNDVTLPGYSPGDFQAEKNADQSIPMNTETLVTFPVENYDPDSLYNPVTSKHTVPWLSTGSQLPQMKQRDFVIGLIRMFNMYVAPDPLDEKLLLILPRDHYYASASGTTIDWSQKVDLSKQWTQEPMPLLNFKTHLWKYAEDTDFYNKLYRDTWGKNYGDKELNVATDFQTEVSEIVLPFAATPSVQSSLNGFVFPTIVKENPIDFPIGNVFAGKPRILYYGGMKDSDQWALTDGVTEFIKDEYPFASHVDDPVDPELDLLFDAPQQVYWYLNPSLYTDNNLYNEYYSKFIEEITDKDSKLLTAYLQLTPFDIQIFDFKYSYYVLNHAFKVNKIIDFKPNTPDVTKVELLKMKEGTAWIKRKVRFPIHPGTAMQKAYLWISPADAVYTLISGLHWFYGGSVDSVFDVSGTTFPMAIISPKDSVF